MKSNDHEHTAFKEYAKNEGLPLNEHPMFLLYTDTVTHNALEAFKAGYKARDARIASLEAQLKEETLQHNFTKVSLEYRTTHLNSCEQALSDAHQKAVVRMGAPSPPQEQDNG